MAKLNAGEGGEAMSDSDLTSVEWGEHFNSVTAERDRYRAALERIERVCGWSDEDGDFAVQVAREALSAEAKR